MKGLGKEVLKSMLSRMHEIRQFEEKIRFLFLEGKMPGTVHQYIGMEACAVGVCTALEEHDVIASTHRPHGHAIARGVTMDSIMGELYGKTTGCCGGKGGSMHVGDLEKGMLPAIAIVGGNLPIVMGMGLAFKIRSEPRVAVSFFGDGASNEGAFHEALNMAAVYGVHSVFVCENNRYGASTSVKRVMTIDHISDRAAAYGMRGDRADGMDVIDVYVHALEAVTAARRGQGPTLLELDTFRLCGHSRRDPNNYMTDEEKEYWQKRDPIPSFEALLKEGKYMTDKEIEELRRSVEHRVDQAIEFGQRSPDPEPEAMYQGLYVNMEVPR
jgi:pyruvate dehydrogenase E1 component alpha subunit